MLVITASRMPSKVLVFAAAVSCLFAVSVVAAASVKVDIESSQPQNSKVTRQHAYSAMVSSVFFDVFPCNKPATRSHYPSKTQMAH